MIDSVPLMTKLMAGLVIFWSLFNMSVFRLAPDLFAYSLLFLIVQTYTVNCLIKGKCDIYAGITVFFTFLLVFTSMGKSAFYAKGTMNQKDPVQTTASNATMHMDSTNRTMPSFKFDCKSTPLGFLCQPYSPSDVDACSLCHKNHADDTNPLFDPDGWKNYQTKIKTSDEQKTKNEISSLDYMIEQLEIQKDELQEDLQI